MLCFGWWNILKIIDFYFLFLITSIKLYSKWTLSIRTDWWSMSQLISGHDLLYHLYLYSQWFLQILNHCSLWDLLNCMNFAIFIALKFPLKYHIRCILYHLYIFKQLVLKLKRVKIYRVLSQLNVAYLNHEVKSFLQLLIRTSYSKTTILNFLIDW